MFPRIDLQIALAVILAGGAMQVSAQSTAADGSITLHPEKPGSTISRDIFGQFAEQLGNGIYGGVWVGKDSADSERPRDSHRCR